MVPYWWSKPLKESRMATFNARVVTVETKFSVTRLNARAA
jgi:hypothetical protein